MSKFISGLIIGVAITIIGWQTTAMAVIKLIEQVVEQVNK